MAVVQTSSIRIELIEFITHPCYLYTDAPSAWQPRFVNQHETLVWGVSTFSCLNKNIVIWRSQVSFMSLARLLVDNVSPLLNASSKPSAIMLKRKGGKNNTTSWNKMFFFVGYLIVWVIAWKRCCYNAKAMIKCIFKKLYQKLMIDTIINLLVSCILVLSSTILKLSHFSFSTHSAILKFHRSKIWHGPLLFTTSVQAFNPQLFQWHSTAQWPWTRNYCIMCQPGANLTLWKCCSLPEKELVSFG